MEDIDFFSLVMKALSRGTHIEQGGSLAKFWLHDLGLASNYGFNAAELNKIRKLVETNQEFFVVKWDEYFSR